MVNHDLFRCLAPLFVFMRVIAATPFHHKDSIREMVRFRWMHRQTFWFTVFMLVHLSCILFQLFGDFAPLNGGSTKRQTGNSSHVDQETNTVHYTNRILQCRFLIDTFMASKVVLFHLAPFQSFFDRLHRVDSEMPLPSLVAQRARKNIIIGIVMIVLWVTMIYQFFL